MSSITIPVLVALPLLAGATMQRSTGLGLALVAAPFLVAILGPRDGVSFGNALQIVLCLLVFSRTWRDTDWRAVGLLLVGAVVGVPIGAWIATVTPEAPLMIVVGALATLGVALSVFPAVGAALRGSAGGVAAGTAAGLVNAAAGVGGPMLSAYALSLGVPLERFVPTAQVVLLAINAAALLAKGPPALPASAWVAGLVAIALGTAIGGPVSRWLGPERGRRLVVVVSLAGALVTVARGLLAL